VDPPPSNLIPGVHKRRGTAQRGLLGQQLLLLARCQPHVEVLEGPADVSVVQLAAARDVKVGEGQPHVLRVERKVVSATKLAAQRGFSM
jgi:hypothetical protein